MLVESREPDPSDTSTLNVSKSRVSTRKTVAIASLAGAVPALSAAISAPILTRALGPEGRGQVAAILSPMLMADGLGALGVPLALHYFRAKGVPSSVLARMSVRLFAAGSLLVVLLLLGLSGSVARRQGIDLTLLVIVWSLAPVSLLINAIRGLRYGEEAWGRINADKVCVAVIRLLVIVVLWLSAGADYRSVAGTYVGVAMLFGLTLLPRYWKRPDPRRNAAAVSRSSFDRYALRSSTTGLLFLANARLDQALLPLMFTSSQVGLYAVAVTMAELPSILYLVVYQILLTRSAKGEEWSALTRRVRATLGATIAGGLAISIAAQFSGVIFGEGFRDLRGFVPLLSLGVVFTALATMLTALLAGRGHATQASLVQLCAVSADVVMLFALIPSMGTWGACLASAASQLVASAVAIALLMHHAGLPFKDLTQPSFEEIRQMATSRFGRGCR